ncbi:hypothetical protein T8K17_04310 [Thalassobaculum sp. OXR-137]|uniref:hypothetical protein n=1 Tax=Thalassobaculum sp. OXR-137 TaxID=3100173 RepID=UPI002AC8FB63|nr:hypothetical protein [Thalassobaculum sp. OXR-137]WPZ35371.1 hypothetical protein T8K17_04310 [Thalassobaculum sp. OXR-137]
MDLFSVEYQEELRKLHKDESAHFGNSARMPGGIFAPPLFKLILGVLDTHNLSSFLDFGCGKSGGVPLPRDQFPSLKDRQVHGFDPGVAEYADSSKLGSKYSVVFSNDVLEHIEERYIDNNIEFIANRTEDLFIAFIDTYPALKKLSNGLNAHVIIAQPEWWITRMIRHFDCFLSHVVRYNETPNPPGKLLFLGVKSRAGKNAASEIFARLPFHLRISASDMEK